MSDANPSARLKAKISGCRCHIIVLVAITALVTTLAIYCHFLAQARVIESRDWFTMKDLVISIPEYKVAYNHFPIPEGSPTDRDLALRSRGVMLAALIGKDVDGLNPKEINFISLPMANNRQSGLWQDGAEWVLSDRWGESFHIVLDTNGNGEIANPEFGADQSDAKYAEECRNNPPPPTLPAKVIIYSSGPDRDPKTWHDNICSWTAFFSTRTA